MFDVAVAATVFGLVLLAEIPDKTALATLVLGTRFPWRGVFVGVCAAFLTHVGVAVGAGALLTLLPDRPVEALVAVLFVLGAFLVWREGRESPEEPDKAAQPLETVTFSRVAGLSYGIVFLAEWGDLTQILTANLVAKYHDPLSVAIGAALGLCSVALLALLGGKALLRVLPMIWITRIAALLMLGLGIYSASELVAG